MPASTLAPHRHRQNPELRRAAEPERHTPDSEPRRLAHRDRQHVEPDRRQSCDAEPDVQVRRLSAYLDAARILREVVALPGAASSTLVVDRRVDGEDARLVAHLWPDESPWNARVVCSTYLLDPSRGRCRALRAEDLSDPADEAPASDGPGVDARLSDPRGNSFAIEAVAGSRARLELRWVRRDAEGEEAVVSLRTVVGALEEYEPARTLTAQAIAHGKGAAVLCASTLAGELRRLAASRLVLNRGLREAVIECVEARRLSLSQIAIRCGRVKRDGHGRISGETSWIARRLGMLPDGWRTPWVHSEVLALIAREGLGLSPHEVEL